MVRTIAPREAEALIAAGGIDVVDVREPHEYAPEHIAGSRNLPLAELKANPKGKLPQGKLLFVCARGMRSQTAAEVAESIGLHDVYHLDGGMQAWEVAGLPLERHAPAPRPARASAPEDKSCGLPDPGLDVVVGANMSELRTKRGISLDELAQRTGLSRTLLGQIELGKTSPSVSVVWKIARAFDVHFSALLSTPEHLETQVLRGEAAKRLVSPDGRFSSRALYPLAEKPDAEFYELFLAGHSREDAQPHQAGTRENLIVVSGRLELYVGSARYDLAKGDAIVFRADVPHSYVNPGPEPCWMYLVMTYAGGSSGG